MMISEKVAARINEQVTNEFFAEHTYLAMSFALESMNLKGFAAWFAEQAAEEHTHALKMAKYILDQGAEIDLGEIPKPKSDYSSVVEIVEAALAHELKVTRQIHEIADLAEAEKDRATMQFNQWFVTEQVEEVATFTDLLAMVKMAETPGQLLMLQENLKREQSAE